MRLEGRPGILQAPSRPVLRVLHGPGEVRKALFERPAAMRLCGRGDPVSLSTSRKEGLNMGREAMIRADMEAVGIYNPIFDATIRQLAKTERELSRAEKDWRANGGQMVAAWRERR